MQNTLQCGLQTNNKIMIAIFILILCTTTMSKVEILHGCHHLRLQVLQENIGNILRKNSTQVQSTVYSHATYQRERSKVVLNMKLVCKIKKICFIRFITVTSRKLLGVLCLKTVPFWQEETVRLMHRIDGSITTWSTKSGFLWHP